MQAAQFRSAARLVWGRFSTMSEQFHTLDLTTTPAPAEVLQARLAAHQTQDQAAATVGLGAAIRWS